MAGGVTRSALIKDEFKTQMQLIDSEEKLSPIKK
jgi:hypothetical protein